MCENEPNWQMAKIFDCGAGRQAAGGLRGETLFVRPYFDFHGFRAMYVAYYIGVARIASPKMQDSKVP